MFQYFDYVEQTSGSSFNNLDDLEQDREVSAPARRQGPTLFIIGRSSAGRWAAPKGPDGKIDFNVALSGDDLIDFVNRDRCSPPPRRIRESTEDPNTIEYKIGEIFSEIKNKIQSGYNLRSRQPVDELRFRSSTDKHEMSHLYEDKIKNMGNAGRNGGEYHAPDH